MPVRSLNSSVFTWPRPKQVERALREWWAVEKSSHPETWRFGYFGSYARGDWGVGSDLDLVAFVADSPFRFDQRSLSWDLTALPVPAELVVYTLEEWQQLKGRGSRLVSQIEREAVWIYSRAPAD
jgi:uncharacterized protein